MVTIYVVNSGVYKTLATPTMIWGRTLITVTPDPGGKPELEGNLWNGT